MEEEQEDDSEPGRELCFSRKDPGIQQPDQRKNGDDDDQGDVDGGAPDELRQAIVIEPLRVLQNPGAVDGVDEAAKSDDDDYYGVSEQDAVFYGLTDKNPTERQWEEEERGPHPEDGPCPAVVGRDCRADELKDEKQRHEKNGGAVPYEPVPFEEETQDADADDENIVDYRHLRRKKKGGKKSNH